MPDMVTLPGTVFCNDLKQYTNSAFQRQTEPRKYTLECIFCSTLVGIMRRTVCTLACLAFAVALYAQTPETRANHAYQAAAQRGPLAMHAFLAEFPKGADLHVHLSGAVYAETFIRDAGEDGLHLEQEKLVAGKEGGFPDEVGGPDRLVAEPKVRNSGRARFL